MRKMLMLVSIAALALALVLCACAQEKTVSVGDIWLVFGGEQYAPFQNWIFSLDQDGLAGDGERKQAKDIVEELESIAVSDGAQIVIEGKTNGLQYYTLYDAQYQEVYYRQEEFVMPEAPGKYILCAEVTWGTQKVYEGYQYFFMIEK